MEKFVKCEGCSNSKIEVFHSADGSHPQTAYRLLDANGKPAGMLVVGEPPAHLAPDPIQGMSTDLLGLLATVILAGRRPDAATMAKAMAGRASDTAAPVKLHEGGLTGARPTDLYAAARKSPLSEADKPAEEPKVPAKPLKSLGLHICEDGGVVVTEWPAGAHPLTAVFASKSAGHAVGYALSALQKARQEQRQAKRGSDKPFIVAVDLGADTGMSGFGLRP